MGPGLSGDQLNRTMISGAQALGYNLYTNPARTAIWGDGTGGADTLIDGYLLNLFTETKNYPLYGRLFGGQNVSTGSSADLIIVTVEF